MSLAFHHAIKHNMKNERMRHIMAFDVESKLIKGEKGKKYFDPFLWTMIYSRFRPETGKYTEKKYWGTDIEEFWDRVESYTRPKDKVMLSSHHLEPDFIPLQGIIKLPERGWKLSKYINHNRILYFEFTRNGATLLVINSGNIFPGGIADWGESLGFPKLDMPSEKDPITKWLPYCMRDSEILIKMWQKYIEFLDIHDLGNMQNTAASQAMTAYRHRFMETTIAIHRHGPTMALERAGYHGGRFQALAIGTPTAGKFWRLDINSMYGQIMRDEELPCELRGYESHCTVKKLDWLLKRFLVMADVTIEVNEPFIPNTSTGKIKYHTGKMRVVLSTPELELLKECGKVLRVHKVSYYKKFPIFRKYADYFLSLRAQYKVENEPVFEKLAKLFVNSLYGKFGQYGYSDKTVGTCDPNIIKYEESRDANTGKTIGYLFYNGKIHVTEKSGSAYNTFVAIAAHITAYGRVRLWRLMRQAGTDHVFHVATDSLIVDAHGLRELYDEIDNKRVGALKIEACFKSLVIKAPNDMMLDGKRKIKGVSKKAPELDPNTFVVTQWVRFNTLLKKGEVERYYTRDIVKHLNRIEFNSLDADGLHVKVRYEYD